MNIRPLHDRVLVRKVREADKTKSGLIHLPETAQQGSQLGLVVAVGEGRSFDGPGMIQVERGGKDIPENGWTCEWFRQVPVVKVGQVVLFGKFSGTEVEVEGDTVFILREDEVVAVIEDAPQELIDRAQKIAAH
jgi:chaperonin GroES